MRQVLDDTLSLGAKNSVVHAFKKLVYNSLGKDFKSEDKNATTNTTIPPRYIAELDKDLYNKASSIPEAQTVTFEKTESADKFQYGEFSGGTVYKTLEGDIDEENKDVRKQEGWLILDRSSTEYALFVAESGTYIIAIKSFTPTSIIKDFKPLYDRLTESKHTNSIIEDSVKVDTKYIGALAATYKNDVSDIVTSYTETEYDYQDSASVSGSSDKSDKFSLELPLLSLISSDVKVKIYQAWLLYMQAVMLWGDVVFLGLALNDKLNRLKNMQWLATAASKNVLNDRDSLFWDYCGIYPHLEQKKTDAKKEDAYNDIQAVVYALKNDNINADSSEGIDTLLCYQNPETLSYTSQSSYDSVQTRGTQQPLQYYNMANQIDFSFTLKWHVDEAMTMGYSLQDIAELSERLTRPWDMKDGCKGKLCKVILPSIIRTGYITSAQIQYSGDMTGGSVGVFYKDKGAENSERGWPVTSYGYNMLEVTFNMIVVQEEVKLIPMDEADNYSGFPVIETDEFVELSDKNKTVNDAEQGELGMFDTIMGTVGNVVNNGVEIAETTIAVSEAATQIITAEAKMVEASVNYFSSL